MSDTPPSATPMPAQPVATVTSPEAPSPPADPLPVFVPPSVTDPVSNLDFPPVDDAFALEMRAETIEQLAGGDALRRGESERIEAGRSQTNANLVAGRDRVRVRGALHEHTGHGLAEQAAHLHTTVEGTLDIHAASEDTVLLAGHMSDLWDGGAAIVATMTDDTVAGGGIRVTTPLDLWVHGLMGVEERIGTCTADAVLLELGATHYEREYGPGAHAAGLAAYTGSLYQSSRSTFRALIRVSSGVRNLIPGGGGGGGGGDAGARSAPGASPPPTSAAGGAGTQAASETLCAATGAGATAQAGVMAGVRWEDLTGIHRGDEVAALAGGANVAGASGDLTELRRGTDTAGQLAALHDTMRGAEANAQGEMRSVLRVSEPDDTASVHEASALDIVADIRSGGTVPAMDASVLHSTVSPPQPPPGVKLGLLGGADRLPQPAAPESDVLALYRRLHERLYRYQRLSRTDIANDFDHAAGRVSSRLLHLFKIFGGNTEELAQRPAGITTAEQACLALEGMALQAECEAKFARAVKIRNALDVIGTYANDELQRLSTKYGIADAPFTQAIQRPPATARPIGTVEVSPPPAHATIQSDMVPAYRQLRGLANRSMVFGWKRACSDFHAAADRISQAVMRRYVTLGGNPERLLSLPSGATRTEQAYRAIEDMARRAAKSGGVGRASQARRDLEAINRAMSRELRWLSAAYGALDALSTQTTRPIRATQAMRLPPMQLPSVTVPSKSLPPAVQLDIPGPAHHIAPEVTPAFHESAGGLAHTTDVPGPPPAPSLPEPSLGEAGGLGRARLDPPATASGATAAHPAASEAIVTPSLAGPCAFWLQPVDPVPAPGTVQFDPRLHHAGETAPTDVPGPPPASSLPEPSLFEAGDLGRARLGQAATTPAQPTTTEAIFTPSLAGASSLRLQPADPVLAPGTVPLDSGLHGAGEAAQPPPVTTTPHDDGFAVERALIAGDLPLGFDASQLIFEANMFTGHGLAEALVEMLAAGLLPVQTIDALIEGYRATDEGGRNTRYIEYLRSLKESIERALRDAYPGRVDPQWLDDVQKLPRWRDVRAPGRTGAGAGAPPTGAYPGRSRPPGMSGGPHPVASDPWSAPPGPSGRARYTETIRTPVLSTGAPPGWQGAETPGFSRAASGAVELPFSRRKAIARRFRTDYALLEAERALRTGGAGALGWTATRQREVLDDLARLNAIAQLDAAAAAAGVDIDWGAIEALVRILRAPPPLR